VHTARTISTRSRATNGAYGLHRRTLWTLAAPAATLLLSAAACAPGQPAAEAPFDRQLIDMMVPHHEGAVAMARVAEQRSQRAEIKQLAADILRSQDAEIRRMKAWRRTWYGSDQTPPMSRMPMVPGTTGAGTAGHGGRGAAGTAGTVDMAADVERLRGAPEPFDRALIDAMIPHHESAIDAAKAAGTRAQHAEIKELARDIIREQEREIALMRQWRQAWYG
jgi:uncharacterized protein (DUF305 family)